MGGRRRAGAGPSGRVDTATFERILDGRLPDGSQVGDPATRDQGRDFTFSMPKSASLLALVSGDSGSSRPMSRR
jgi:conjugative relaxase-like TrwC/TraI family protein